MVDKIKNPRYKTIFENDCFKLTYDLNQNSFWIWDKLDGINIAMKAKTELEAYKSALNSAIDWKQKYKQKRDEASQMLYNIGKLFSNTDYVEHDMDDLY